MPRKMTVLPEITPRACWRGETGSSWSPADAPMWGELLCPDQIGSLPGPEIGHRSGCSSSRLAKALTLIA